MLFLLLAFVTARKGPRHKRHAASSTGASTSTVAQALPRMPKGFCQDFVKPSTWKRTGAYDNVSKTPEGCMTRCLKKYPMATSFYVNSKGQCGCSKTFHGLCDIVEENGWQTYEIARDTHVCAADELQKCSCQGIVYYGRKLTRSGKITDLAGLKSGGKYKTKAVHGEVTCSNAVMGDPLPHVHKHCICVPESRFNYVGCIDNGHTAGRIEGHVDKVTYPACTKMALGKGLKLFGMEHPKGYPHGEAQCLVLKNVGKDLVHDNPFVKDAKCEEEVANGKRMGGFAHAAVYELSNEVRSCKGFDCTIDGQFCPPHAPGSTRGGYCCRNKKWVKGACDATGGWDEFKGYCTINGMDTNAGQIKLGKTSKAGCLKKCKAYKGANACEWEKGGQCMAHKMLEINGGNGSGVYTCWIARQAFVDFGWDPPALRRPLGQCQGDCDEDKDCQRGMKCVNRNGMTPIDGCTGLGSQGHDYCVRQVNKWPQDFKWSANGKIADWNCLQVKEPAERKLHRQWSDNYFCSRWFMDMRWSYSGVQWKTTHKCFRILENADIGDTWHDNYLCIPKTNPLNLVFHSAGPMKGKKCIQWKEPADMKGTWHDNYLCA